MIKYLCHQLLILSICLLSCISLYARGADSAGRKTAKDTGIKSFVAKMQAFAKTSAGKSADEFAADKAAIAQNSIFEQIKKTTQKAKIYLKTGVDTVGTKEQFVMIEKDFAIAGDGVFTNKGTAQTFRNLTATSKILAELLSKANATKAKLDRH